ncbi:MAG: AAA family ATPase [Methylococcaceae bacterium]|nr:AAA family ATPase [Methylococcaceae bacterium]
MTSEIDFTKVRTSWTKYDVVQVMEVIYDKETLYKFINKEAGIDEPILKSFLGIKSLEEPLPNYWLEIQNYPNEKQLFALFAVIFTHGEIVQKFANQYSKGNMKGIFELENGKQYTNVRSALIESGAATPTYRRMKSVPYDFSPIFQNFEVGKLFKQVLEERISRLTKVRLLESDFYDICYINNFHKALSLTETEFKSWLEGIKKHENSYIDSVKIKNFFSIEEVNINHIKHAKEVYFLGENGDGKSLILMAIYLAFNRYYILNSTDKEETGKAIDIIDKNNNIELIGIDSKNKTYDSKNTGFLSDFFAYGTHRGRYSTDNAEKYGFMSLFDSDQTLTNPISWLKDKRLLELEKNRDSIDNSLTESSSFFSIKNLERLFYDLLERNVNINIHGKDVVFTEKGTQLTFDQLSEGYKSIIIFVVDLLSRLQMSQPEIENIKDLHGIVLVDEIDLHLHPKWERVLVSKLRSLFPNVQFMFTTHSPTIIQGASDNAIIYRVYRNSDDGKTRVSDPYFRKDLNHLMINTLVTSPLFGLENSRLNPKDDYSDTSEDFLIYKVFKKLKQELDKQKTAGKEFISDIDIDN